jgi:ribonucleotide monophosphatase NagD (HAD superfamily)
MLSVAGLLLLPAAWSWSASANPSLNSTLPQAGPHQGASGQTFGSQSFDAGTPQLAAWLKSHSDADATWQLVVSSAQNASTLIAKYQVSVMALGGFSGWDNSITVAGFADLVSSGAARYVLVGQEGWFGGNAFGRALAVARAYGQLGDASQQGMGPGGFGGAAASGSNAVMSAAQSACTTVSDTSLPSRYQGVLYDCAGAGDAILAAGGN